MTAYEYVDGRGVHAAPPVGLAGAGTAAAPAALSGEAPRSFAGASGASSGVCPACGATVDLYSDGTVADHHPRSGERLRPNHPLACPGTRFVPVKKEW
jgi:hypothetical protein